MAVKHLFEFGDFTLSVDERTLQRGDESISLTPKMFELLLVFVRHPNRVLERELLLKSVWPDSFVEEGSVSFNIRQLRKALGDDAQKPIFIETVPRRGYRFVAQVEESSAGDQPVASAPSAAGVTPRNHRSNVFVVITASLLALLILGAAAGWFLTRPSIRAMSLLSAPFAIERLSTDGQVHLVAISGDGKAVVYSRQNAGKQSLWIMQPGTTDNSQIVPLSDYVYFGITFSPDGRSIYYSRGLPSDPQQADVYRESIYGGVPQRIVSHAQGWISLSPDGKKLSFVRCPYTEDEHCSLWIADAADGANERKLISRPPPFRIGDNKFSSDGRSIAFAVGQSRTYSNDFGLSEVDIESGVEHELTKEKFFNIHYLAWLPDRQGLLLTARHEPDKNFRIWEVNSAGDSTPLTDDTQTYSALALNNDASALVTTEVTANFQLDVYQTDDPASGPRRLANALAVDYAPDGGIVFTSPRTGNPEIWTIKSDGSAERQLTNDPADDVAPIVSTDNNYILFASNRTGEVQIWKMNRDGSNQTEVTFQQGGTPEFVSPDGQWLYYKSALRKDFRRVSLSDSHEEEVFDRPSDISAMAPTGDRVALSEDANGRTSIQVLSVPDGQAIKTYRFAEPKAHVISLVWSHDGKYLAYVLSDERDLEQSLWFQTLDDQKPRKITDLREEVFEVSSLALSPDDRYFAVVQGTWRHDAVLIKGLKKIADRQTQQ